MKDKINQPGNVTLKIQLLVARRINSIFLIANRKLLQTLGFNSADLNLSHLRQLNVLKPVLSSSDLKVMDGGANIGDFSKLVLNFNPNAKLICVEPQPSLATQLRNEFSECDVIVVEKAIAADKGKLTLHLDYEGDRKASTANVRNSSLEIVVDADTVPNILQDLKINHVAILKLDLEGADAKSIICMFEKSKIRPDVIIIEVSYLSSFFGIRPTEIHSQLMTHSYSRIFRTSPRFGLVPLESKKLSDYEGHTTNWIALLDDENHESPSSNI